MENEKKEIALIISGGIGKELCATTLIKWLKEKGYDKIITLSGYPEVFNNNPHVYRNLHMNTSYLEDDYLKGIDIRQGEVYQMIEYREGRRHLNQLMPIAYRFGDEENSNIFPEIYPSKHEIMEVKKIISSAKTPIVTVQFQGGPIMMDASGQPISGNSARDLTQKQAQLVVDTLTKNNFSVLQIRAGNQFICQNTQVLNLHPRMYMILSKFTAGHIGIDSFMNHVAACWKKPALIFWNQTKFQNLGYPTATNINRDACPIPMCNRPRVGYGDIIPGGIWNCPYGKVCQKWTDDEVIKSVDEFCRGLRNEEKTKTLHK